IDYISVIKMHFGTNLPAGRFGGRTAHAPAILEDGGAREKTDGTTAGSAALMVIWMEKLGRRIHGGSVKCIADICDMITCEHPVTPPGKCCPECVNCHYRGQILRNGERFQPDLCTTCTCKTCNFFFKSLFFPPLITCSNGTCLNLLSV
ncbi:unnamed protein product, partial [Ranitomeya imitator]